jgi:ribonuclease E
MSVKILINAVDPEECRIAKVRDSKLEEFHVESASKAITHGNIYKGVITRIEPSLQAVFVDYGGAKNGFLQKQEVHSDYFHDSPSGDKSIKSLLKKGQELMVQVTKDPIMNKGAMLTTFISLPGRYIVLMPGHEVRGVSRKIEDEAERKRLKEIANEVDLPEGYGMIIRTAGVNATKTVIQKDLRYLMRLWKTIKDSVMQVPTPYALYKERNLVVRSIRDYFTSDVEEILIDNPVVYKEAKDFLKIISPKHTQIVKLHKGEEPIFSQFAMEDQLASIFENKVELKSGGSIVIEQTEALVAIDVNSGKSTQKNSIEQTALSTNLEAAEEIARQLRLRDLGGLIVLDFIDMRESKHRMEVGRVLKSHLKEDKAKTNLGKISKFGLLEMSRQRLRPSIDFGSYIPCPYCKGKGTTPSIEYLGLRFFRRLHLESAKESVRKISAIAPPAVMEYLLNEKRKELAELEARKGIRIHIREDASMMPGDGEITSEA